MDDLSAMPRFAMAAQHPAVKRQLEEMGVIETDEQVRTRLTKVIENKNRRGDAKDSGATAMIMRGRPEREGVGS